MLCGLTYLSSCVDFTSDFLIARQGFPPERLSKKKTFSSSIWMRKAFESTLCFVVRLMTWHFTTAKQNQANRNWYILNMRTESILTSSKSCWRRNFNRKYLLAHEKNMSVWMWRWRIVQASDFALRTPSAIGKINEIFKANRACSWEVDYATRRGFRVISITGKWNYLWVSNIAVNKSP